MIFKEVLYTFPVKKTHIPGIVICYFLLIFEQRDEHVKKPDI